MTTILTTTTELEAVNTMLEAVGASPVSSLDATEDADLSIARAVLSETCREVQSQGWDFNLDTRYSIARTVDNEYVVPSNVLDIKLSQDFQYLRATFRAGKLWDQDKHTFAWTVDLTFDVTWLFDFVELPQTARHYITLRAARKFQARVLGSDTLGKFTGQDEFDARAIFVDAECVDADHNILTGNYSVYRTLDRWASYPVLSQV